MINLQTLSTSSSVQAKLKFRHILAFQDFLVFHFVCDPRWRLPNIAIVGSESGGGRSRFTPRDGHRHGVERLDDGGSWHKLALMLFCRAEERFFFSCLFSEASLNEENVGCGHELVGIGMELIHQAEFAFEAEMGNTSEVFTTLDTT
jgi:hypothetical protein